MSPALPSQSTCTLEWGPLLRDCRGVVGPRTVSPTDIGEARNLEENPKIK